MNGPYRVTAGDMKGLMHWAPPLTRGWAKQIIIEFTFTLPFHVLNNYIYCLLGLENTITFRRPKVENNRLIGAQKTPQRLFYWVFWWGAALSLIEFPHKRCTRAGLRPAHTITLFVHSQPRLRRKGVSGGWKGL